MSASGPTLADSVGASPATTSAAPPSAYPAAFANDPDTAVRFDGNDDAASAAVNLSGKSAITVEFWMKWNAWANDDKLAFEYTPNFNDDPGGFLVDPNSSYGSFAVALGVGASRNVALFARPSAGVWHHYAFVLDTAASAEREVVPYVDGQPVAFTQGRRAATGAGNFANSTLNFMSRDGTALFGAGDLDEVALYGRALDAGTIAQHYASFGANKRPTAGFRRPPSRSPAEQVNFDASASSDPDGTIAKYEWDLDGNGSYETNTGTTPTVSHAYADRRQSQPSACGSPTTPAAARQRPTRSPSPRTNLLRRRSPSARTRHRWASRSASTPRLRATPRARSPNTNGTSTATAATRPTPGRRRPRVTPTPPPGDVNVGLRVTDSAGATATASQTVTVDTSEQLGYSAAVQRHTGPARLLAAGRDPGSTFADSAGASPASDHGRARPRGRRRRSRTSRPRGRASTATDGAASAALDRSAAEPRSRSSSG